jgi:hypothetical protein
MKLPSAPLCNTVRWWALKKIKEIGERLNTMGIDQTTLLILSIQPGTRTHLPPLLVSSPLSHPRNLVKVPATKSRSAGRPAQLRLQRKEAQREGARPQLLERRGLHQPWRRPWASSSSSPNAGRGASAGSATSCRPDASRWPHCSCGGLLRPLSVPLLHRFFVSPLVHHCGRPRPRTESWRWSSWITRTPKVRKNALLDAILLFFDLQNRCKIKLSRIIKCQNVFFLLYAYMSNYEKICWSAALLFFCQNWG